MNVHLHRGGRPSVLADVAVRAGVSHQTVSRVVNRSPHVAAATRARVERAIAELDYRPNNAARTLVTGVARRLGLVTLDVDQYGPWQTMLGLERAARQAGYSLAIAAISSVTDTAVQEAVEHMVAQSVDAIVALATYPDVLAAVREVRTSVPVVTVQAGPDPERATVWIDQTAGTRLATRHLLDLGHRTVHHIAGPEHSFEAQQRLVGWRRELARDGVLPPGPLRGDWSPGSGHAAGRQLVELMRGPADRRPTAVVVANDQMALGVLKAVQEAGFTVPGDLSVVGFDDSPESGCFLPALTTVHQDFAELGRRAVDRALGQLRDERPAESAAVVPHLVVRDSSAPPAAVARTGLRTAGARSC